MSGFDAYGVTSSEGSSGENNVDFDALNAYVIKTVDCEQPETMNGYISMIVDLGTQKQPDGEWNVDDEDVGLTVEELTEKHAELIAEGKINKFELSYDNDVKAKVIKKFVPQKDRQSIVYAVDFPDTQLDKGQFFGNDTGETKPLRLWIGGQFWNPYQSKMLVQNMIPLKIVKDDKIGWTMNPKSSTYKIALASRLIKTGESFMPESIDKLLGQTLQFQIQIFNQSGKNGKTYYTEKLKFVGAIQKKDKPFEGVETKLIQFNKENDVEALKEVRNHVLHTIMQATNFEGSAIHKQLLEVRPKLFDGVATSSSITSTKAVAEDVKKEVAPADNEVWD